MAEKISFVAQGGEWENRKISVFGALASFITQLSIGDDLTKISIPSVLLYPYSALEFGAYRFLSFVDILLAANKEEDPLKRFLGVVKWFLAYTQKEKLGKKPYNPILAETHLAWVDHTGTDFKGITKFFSEQTSHHPPISAVVIENVEEKFYLTANAKFSTSFHGNSVTAYPEGSTAINFGTHDETYEFPKGIPLMVVKNVIIGTRRHAWEGEVSVSCGKSGYKAVLNYFEDGWWCINSVSGYIVHQSNPETKLYTFVGPLDGNVTLTNCKTNQAELFIDLAHIARKQLKYIPFEKLAHTDSVKVWRELSEAIVVDDMVKADIAKRAVEDAQRKRRNESKSYTPTYFTLNEQNRWVFVDSRLEEINNMIATADEPLPPKTTESDGSLEEKSIELAKPDEIVDVQV